MMMKFVSWDKLQVKHKVSLFGIGAVLVTYVVYIFIRRAKLQKQTDKFNKLLYVHKCPEKYITEVDKLLRKLQSDTERNINLIQKTTGLFICRQI